MKGHISEDALAQYAELAAQKQGLDFSEGETYDFARCIRPDGKVFGTSGRCQAPNKPATVAGQKKKKEEGKGGEGFLQKAKRQLDENLKAGFNPLEQSKVRGKRAAERNAMVGNAVKKLFGFVEEEEVDYNEEGTLDFARCQRSDGTFYGTRGKCKKGKEAGAKESGKTTPESEKKRLAPELEAYRKERDAMTAKIRGEAKKEGEAKRSSQESERKRLAPELEAYRKERDAATAKVRDEAKKEGDAKRAAAEGKPKRKPATSAETKPKWQETERVVKAAKENLKRVKAETKGDKSPEARERLLKAGQALDKAERLAQKASDKYFAAAKRESRASMTPEQRKEEREWNKQKKMYG